MAKPVSVKVDTFGTGDERAAADFVMNNFDFRPRAIIEKLNLLRPIYRQSTNYEVERRRRSPSSNHEERGSGIGIRDQKL